jgi:hypothetical protein
VEPSRSPRRFRRRFHSSPRSRSADVDAAAVASGQGLPTVAWKDTAVRVDLLCERGGWWAPIAGGHEARTRRIDYPQFSTFRKPSRLWFRWAARSRLLGGSPGSRLTRIVHSSVQPGSPVRMSRCRWCESVERAIFSRVCRRPTGEPASPDRTSVRLDLEARRVAERFELLRRLFEFHRNKIAQEGCPVKWSRSLA